MKNTDLSQKKKQKLNTSCHLQRDAREASVKELCLCGFRSPKLELPFSSDKNKIQTVLCKVIEH